jgi:hypothetical protein
MNRELLKKLLFCCNILVCVFFCCFLRFDFVNWVIIFLLVDRQFEVEEVFLLRKRNAPGVFSFHLLSLSLSLSLSGSSHLAAEWS